MWGSAKTDSRGHLIEEILNEENLFLLNTKSPTHISMSSGNQSSIDLSIASSSLFPLLQWSVIDDLHGSDHFPLLILPLSWPLSSPHKPIYNLSKADWMLYSSTIERPEFESGDPDNNLKSLIQNIHAAASQAIPKSLINASRPPVPWWNPNCKKAIRDRKTSLNRFKHNPTLENLINYKRYRAKAKKVILEAKRISWSCFTKSLSEISDSKTFWNKIRRIKGKPTRTIHGLLDQGVFKSTEKEIANILAYHFASISSDTNLHPDFIKFKQSHQHPLNFHDKTPSPINSPFSLKELQSAIKKCRSSAPGPDGILIPLIKNLPPQLLDFLLRVYNDIWSSGIFPQSWQSSILIPLLKPNKPNIQATSYRPISLTNHLCKIMERIVHARISWLIESKSLISKHQYGFRHHRSTTDHLIGLSEDIWDSFSRGNHLVAVFLDLKNAFDTLWKYNITKTLHDWGIKGHTLNFISNFLQNRSFRVKINNSFSDELTLENGVPQGSVLSPLLFNIAINNVTQLFQAGIKHRLYADDIVIYYSSHSPHVSERKLQLCLNNLSKWCLTSGFSFSPSKSSSVHFCRKRNCPRLHQLSLSNLPIASKSSVKFLGLHFDYRLSWNEHIINLKTDCSKTINIIKWLSHSKFGCSQSVLFHLYITLIRSKLDYGSIVYLSSPKSYLAKLDVIQNNCLRLISGAFRTSPITSLHSLLGIMPLKHHRLNLLFQYAMSLKFKPFIPTYSSFFRPLVSPNIILDSRSDSPGQIFSNFCKDHNITIPECMPLRNATTPPWELIAPSINNTLIKLDKKSTPPSLIKASFYGIIQDLSPDNIIYTDGSKFSQAAGCAVLHNNMSYKYRLLPTTSILSAELFAIKESLRIISNLPPSKWMICSDSLNALQCLNELSPKHPLAVKSLDLHHSSISKGSTVDLVWIPSHVGIRGNEDADKIAKTAANDGDFIPLAFSISELKFLHMSTIKSGIQAEWEVTGDSNKLYECKPQFFQVSVARSLSRSEEVIWNRLRLGHCYFTHSFLLKGDPPPNCSHCGNQLTVYHLLIECPSFNNLRQSLGLNGDLASVLDANNLHSLFQFIRASGLGSLI